MTLLTYLSIKRFHHDQYLDFDPQSTKSPQEMAVSLVGRIMSPFARPGKMEAKKT